MIQQKVIYYLTKPSVFIIILFFFVHLPFVLKPIKGVHTWRQSDTAAVARNFVEESPNIFYPRIDVRRNLTGITGMEFPLYQYLVAGLFFFTGSDHDSWGKLLTLLFALLAMVYTAKVFKLLFKTDNSLTYPILFATPYFFVWSSKFMPGICGLALVMFGVYNFYCSIHHRTSKNIIFCYLGLALGSLIRPYFIFWNLPILFWLLRKLINKKKIDFYLLTLGLAILIPFLFWYFVWCPHLVKTYGLKYFFTGGQLKDILPVIITGQYWIKLITAITQNYVNFSFIPLFAVGIWTLVKNNRESNFFDKIIFTLTILVISIISLALLTSDHFLHHGYYFLGLVPAIALVNILGLSHIQKKLYQAHFKSYFTDLIIVALAIVTFMLCWLTGIRNKTILFFTLLPIISFNGFNIFKTILLSKYRTLGIVGIFLTVISLSIYSFTNRFDPRYKVYKKAQEFVDHQSNKNDLFVIMIKNFSLDFHAIRRRGWPVARKNFNDYHLMKELKSQGAKWVMLLDQNKMFNVMPITKWINNLKLKQTI